MRDFGLGLRQLGFRIQGQRAFGFARSRAFGVQHFQALGFGALGVSPGFGVEGYGFSLSQGLCSGHQGVESMFRVGFRFWCFKIRVELSFMVEGFDFAACDF